MTESEQLSLEMRRKRLEHQLETQSQHVERVFARHQFPAQVTGGAVRAGATRFTLWTQLEDGLDRLKDVAQDIGKALGVSLIALDGHNGRLHLQVESADEPWVPLLSMLERGCDWPGVTALLGITEGGAPIMLDFRNENTAHMLISGDSGSGKTSLLRTMSLSLSWKCRQSQLQLFVVADIDKGRRDGTLSPLQHLPHMLAPVAWQQDEAADILGFLVDELAYRRQQGTQIPAIVLMIDEVVALAETAGTELMAMVTRLAQHGAKSGIHLALTTRYPDSTHLGTMFRSSLPVRIVGQTADARRAGIAAGIREPAVEYLSGQGEFVAVIDGSEPLLFQAAHASDYDLHLCLNEMQRNRPRPILAQPIRMRELRYGNEAGDEAVEVEPVSFVFNGEKVYMAPALENSGGAADREDEDLEYWYDDAEDSYVASDFVYEALLDDEAGVDEASFEEE